MKQNPISAQVLKELKSLTFPRYYFKDKPEVSGCTIDGPESKDLDDGIDFKKTGENYLLQVSIADVTSLVKPDSEIFKEALRRVETKYFRGGNGSMLPKALSESKMSLLPHTKKATITFEIELSPQADILDFKFYESVFTNRRRLCYRDFDLIIKSLKSDPDYIKFNEMAAFAKIMLEKRRNNGALAIYDLKKGIYTNEEGSILPLNEDMAHVSNIVIQEFMILTNKAIAIFCAENNIPLLFRNHTVRMNAPNRKQILEQINLAFINSKYLNSLRERCNLWFNKADYGLVLQGHFGLNESAYTHITSPIRRVADLINHFALKDYLYQGKPAFGINKLQEMANSINEKNIANREEKANYMKEKAFFASKIKLNYSNEEELVKMKISDFTPVLSAAARENVLLPELESALNQRFESKNIDINIIYILLFKTDKKSPDWVPVKQRALKFISDTQSSAVQLLNLLQQNNIIEKYKFEYDNESVDYGAKVILDIKGKTVKNPEFIYSKRKKDAAHQCSTDILISMLALPGTKIEDTEDIPNSNDSSEPIITDLTSSVKTDELTDNKKQNLLSHKPTPDDKSLNKQKEHFAKDEYQLTDNIDEPISASSQIIPAKAAGNGINENHVGKLLELCIKNEDWSQPVFDFEISGSDHQPVIKCIAKLVASSETIVVEIISNTKKMAKQDAAKKILEKINELGIFIEETKIAKNNEKSNYIGLLQEFCVKAKLQIPQYEYKQIGSGHEPVFECFITMYYSGKKRSFQGRGLNKKISKQNAAEKCYKYLTNNSL